MRGWMCRYHMEELSVEVSRSADWLLPPPPKTSSCRFLSCPISYLHLKQPAPSAPTDGETGQDPWGLGFGLPLALGHTHGSLQREQRNMQALNTFYFAF